MEVLGNEVDAGQAPWQTTCCTAPSRGSPRSSARGMINVDFADVKTVMGEIGMAMMGSAKPRRRPRTARREEAVKCPLLEDITLPMHAACWSTSRLEQVSR